MGLQVDLGPDTPLCVAAQKGHLKVVQELIAAGAALEVASHIDAFRRSPLWWAVHESNVVIMKELIQHGANVNAASTTATPLGLACTRNREATCLLLKCKAETNPSGWGVTPLLSAIEANELQIAHDLLVAGADINKGGEKSISCAR